MRPNPSPSGRRPSFIEDARRAQIVQAAIETVADVGYAGASLSRIAQTAGVSKSVISYHFAGKEDLLTQVVTESYAATDEYLTGQLERAESAPGMIRTWVTAQITFFSQHRQRFLAVSDIAGNYRDAEGNRPFLDDLGPEVDAISEILERGQRCGEFRDFDPQDVALIITRSIEGVLGAWMEDERIDVAAQTEAVADFIDHAIRDHRRPDQAPREDGA